jgi:hypothetical protein
VYRDAGRWFPHNTRVAGPAPAKVSPSVAPSSSAVVDGQPVSLEPSCVIQFTSGSTASPSGIASSRKCIWRVEEMETRAVSEGSARAIPPRITLASVRASMKRTVRYRRITPGHIGNSGHRQILKICVWPETEAADQRGRVYVVCPEPTDASAPGSRPSHALKWSDLEALRW